MARHVLHPLCSDLSGVVADNEGSSSEQAEGSQRNDEEREERGEMGVGTQEKVQRPEEL